MTAPTPRVALVASRPEQRAVSLAVDRLAALVRRGWDAHLVFAHPQAAATDLPVSELASRMHLSRGARPAGRRRAEVPAGVLRGFARQPLGAARFLRTRARRVPRILLGHDVEAVLIALSPDVVHLDAGAPDTRLLSLIGAAAAPPSNPADLDFFQPPSPNGAGPDRLRVLSVGPLTWKHGYEWALQAVALAIARGARCDYRILGRGDHMDAVSFARHDLGLDDRVELLPEPRDRRELRAQLARCDVYLDAAVVACAEGAVTEALAMARPVLGTDRTSAPPGALDGEAGFAVPRRDPEAMADRLVELAGDAGLRRRVGLAARQRLTATAGSKSDVDRLERAFREALGR